MSVEWPAGPQRPDPPGAEVHVWRAALDAPGWPDAGRLPKAERERAAAMRRPDSAARWSAARWALRTVLGRYLDAEPVAIELERDEHGKPRLAVPGPLRFNLSHSGELALVAIASKREVGVDVERIEARRDVLALADRGLDPEDAARVHGAPPSERSAVFHAAWAAHEARLKCLGTGLGAAPPDGATAIVVPLAAGEGYAAALAIGGEEPLLPRLYSLSP